MTGRCLWQDFKAAGAHYKHHSIVPAFVFAVLDTTYLVDIQAFPWDPPMLDNVRLHLGCEERVHYPHLAFPSNDGILLGVDP